jgi:hypothetical protein
MRPHIGLEGGDVQVSHEHHPSSVSLSPTKPTCHLLEKLQLVGKLGISCRVGEIASCRHVNIVDLDVSGERSIEVSSILPATPCLCPDLRQGVTRQDRDTVIRFLAMNGHISKAHFLQLVEWKGRIGNLCLL